MLAPNVSGAVLAVSYLLLAACRSDPPNRDVASDSTSAPASGVSVVTVTATDYAFEAPAEIPAGLTRFELVNRGPSMHHLQLVKLGEGKTGDDFVAALEAGGPPKWATWAGGPNPPEVGQTSSSTSTLEPGNYVMICFIPAADGVPHLMKGMMRPITVTGSSRSAGAEPEANVVMKLVDFDFQLSQPLKAGRQTIRIENAGPQPHELAIIRLNPGKTPADFAHWGERPVGPAPGTTHGGVAAIMPAAHAFVTVDLPPGNYALLCFVPEMKDGKPHFVHGMAKQIEIS